MELTKENVEQQEQIYNSILKNSKNEMRNIGSHLNEDEPDDFLQFNQIEKFLEKRGVKHYMYIPSKERDITYHDDFRNKCFNEYFNSLPKHN